MSACLTSWAPVPHLFRTAQPLPAPWEERFGPLKAGAVDDLVVVGQFGQSLDGRVATESGHSHYINGPAGLAHLHRLRALVDVVVVGVGTALADNPQLTVRHVIGPQSGARGHRSARTDCGGRPHVRARRRPPPGGDRRGRAARTCRATSSASALPAANDAIAPSAILAALAERGFRRMLIEGGSHTVSRFIAAGCLDRLHIVVAPIILGAGRGGVALAPVAQLRRRAASADAASPARRRSAVRLRSVGPAVGDRAARRNRRDRRGSMSGRPRRGRAGASARRRSRRAAGRRCSRAAPAQPVSSSFCMSRSRGPITQSAVSWVDRIADRGKSRDGGRRGRAARARVRIPCRRADAH